MKNYFLAFILFCVSTKLFAQYPESQIQPLILKSGNDEYAIIQINKSDDLIRSKYFAGYLDNNSIEKRFQSWSRGKKLVFYSSGAYMSNCNIPEQSTPIGLCIDNGNLINRNLILGKMDALVLFYSNGGIDVTNINDGNLKISIDNISVSFDIRKELDKGKFLKWAEANEATVFQTHLLAYKDELLTYESGGNQRERRFLIAANGRDGKLYHLIMNTKSPLTLQESATNAFNFLKEEFEFEEIISMINLDVGCQDVFKFFNSDGQPYKEDSWNGPVPMSRAINLIVYYYIN